MPATPHSSPGGARSGPQDGKVRRIFLTGHGGLAGSAILRLLRERGYAKLLPRSRSELDLTRQSDVEQFFAADVIHAACRSGAQKLLFLGSSCVYPKFARQPIPESALLTGSLEPTNEPYAIAKIAGLRICQAYRAQHGFDAISIMPANLYGPNDRFDLTTSHVLPALLRKFHEARVARSASVTLWGSGTPPREIPAGE